MPEDSKITIDEKLLARYKMSIGDLNPMSVLDCYYKGFLISAKADLLSDDISEQALESELGETCVILYAEALMNKTDIATNPTISLLRNKLSLITKGDRIDV